MGSGALSDGHDDSFFRRTQAIGTERYATLGSFFPRARCPLVPSTTSPPPATRHPGVRSPGGLAGAGRAERPHGCGGATVLIDQDRLIRRARPGPVTRPTRGRGAVAPSG